MYSHCIFCSADLQRNDSIEEFPVGRGLAFDSDRGRLWAVCRACGRWNLAPIEERWEATETAEKLFRESRLRVHSENIGLAKLRDGTRLIRVGRALPGELAAWRYGDQLVRRRRQYLWGSAAATGAVLVVVGGMWAAGTIAVASSLINVGNMAWQHRQGRRLVHHLDARESPTGEELWLRRSQLHGARVRTDEAGEVALVLPEAIVPEPGRRSDPEAWKLVLRGKQAESVLARAMVVANSKGARGSDVGRAVDLLARAGSPAEYLRGVAERDSGLAIERVATFGRRRNLPADRRPVTERVSTFWRNFAGTFRGERMPYRKVSAAELDQLSANTMSNLTAEDRRNALRRPESLALEMALHDEAERRALQGELKLLEVAWREAEEIAAIADALPDDPLQRLRR
jgi:hypothetical protein